MGKLWKILVPGIVFQSILIGGGYASGREVMEYAGRLGANGFFVVCLAGILFGLFMFLSFELARVSKKYEYRGWSKQLLGRAWFLFDILFAAMSVIAIAVVTAAAGSTLYVQSQMPYFIATGIIISTIFLLSILGETWILRYKTFGTVLLYVAFFYFFVAVVNEQEAAAEIQSARLVSEDWVSNGIIYAGYNFVVIPACLYAVKELDSRRDVAIASAIGAILAMLPMSILLYIFIIEGGLVSEPLPLLVIIKTYLSPQALLLYYVVLIITLVETGVGLSHAITDRISAHYDEKSNKSLSNFIKGCIASCIALLSLALAQYGIIALVAVGYSVMAWGFLAIMAIPLLYQMPRILAQN